MAAAKGLEQWRRQSRRASRQHDSDLRPASLPADDARAVCSGRAASDADCGCSCSARRAADGPERCAAEPALPAGRCPRRQLSRPAAACAASCRSASRSAGTGAAGPANTVRSGHCARYGRRSAERRPSRRAVCWPWRGRAAGRRAAHRSGRRSGAAGPPQPAAARACPSAARWRPSRPCTAAAGYPCPSRSSYPSRASRIVRSGHAATADPAAAGTARSGPDPYQ